jgi:hypothetical protein
MLDAGIVVSWLYSTQVSEVVLSVIGGGVFITHDVLAFTVPAVTFTYVPVAGSWCQRR